jgi:endoglucanase
VRLAILISVFVHANQRKKFMNTRKMMWGCALTIGLLLACEERSHNADQSAPDTQPDVAAPGEELWVDPDSAAAADAETLRESDPDAARRLQYIADQPMAYWLGDWSGDVEQAVKRLTTQASGKILTLVLYNIPYRDCGSYSAGGTEPDLYRQWVEAVVRGLGSHKALVIVEPDAVAQLDCLEAAAKEERLTLLQEAVSLLKKAPGARVYVDAGHPAWHPADVMAERLLQAGVEAADGFALNVSNFQTLESNISYGRTLRSLLAGKTFVIDTSRNGRGPDPQGEWCNPRSRALGRTPTLQTDIEGVDALLWVKRPGESDGSCNGGPGAGQWWREIALDMAQGAGI